MLGLVVHLRPPLEIARNGLVNAAEEILVLGLALQRGAQQPQAAPNVVVVLGVVEIEPLRVLGIEVEPLVGRVLRIPLRPHPKATEVERAVGGVLHPQQEVGPLDRGVQVLRCSGLLIGVEVGHQLERDRPVHDVPLRAPAHRVVDVSGGDDPTQLLDARGVAVEPQHLLANVKLLEQQAHHRADHVVVREAPGAEPFVAPVAGQQPRRGVGRQVHPPAELLDMALHHLRRKFVVKDPLESIQDLLRGRSGSSSGLTLALWRCSWRRLRRWDDRSGRWGRLGRRVRRGETAQLQRIGAVAQPLQGCLRLAQRFRPVQDLRWDAVNRLRQMRHDAAQRGHFFARQVVPLRLALHILQHLQHHLLVRRLLELHRGHHPLERLLRFHEIDLAGLADWLRSGQPPPP